MSGLGEKYKDRGVTVVGVTREKDHDVSIFFLTLSDEFYSIVLRLRYDLQKVKQFVAEMGDSMRYNVAIDVNLTAREGTI